jgi:hypothetical protein
VAEGCRATAWCMGVVHAHSWLITHFPSATQEEMHSANPDALMVAVIAPRAAGRGAPGMGIRMDTGSTVPL